MSDTLGATVTPNAKASTAEDDAALPVTDAHRYVIERELGQGGQSTVFAVRDQALGREVALKTARLKGAAAGTFVREARITGQLEHPGIVPVHELGRTRDGEVYCTQKLVRGRTFRQALDDAKTLEQRLSLLPHFVDLCNAVAYAHSRGVVHRDLKPENVMVGEFGETVVLDWGVARVLGAAEEVVEPTPVEQVQPLETVRRLSGVISGSTQHGSIVGTPLYMSPEQARGQTAEVDAKSDVWSLGVMLYELIAFARPFEGTDVKKLLKEVARGDSRPLKDLAPDAPPELAAIVDRALQPDRSQRLADARQLAQLVADFRAGKRVAAYQYSSWELLKRFVARNKALTVVSALALVSLACSEIIAWNLYGKSERAQREAQKNLAEAMGEQAQTELRARDWTRAHGAFSRALQTEAGTHWALAVRAAEPWAEAAKPLPGEAQHRDAELGVLDGHTGQAMLSFEEQGVETADATGRWSQSARWAPGAPRVMAVAIAPGGQLRAAGTPRLQLYSEGSARELAAEPWAIAFSPDGARLVAAQPGRLEVFSVRGEAGPKALAPPFEKPKVVAFGGSGALVAVADQTGAIRWWSGGAAPVDASVSPRPINALAFSADARLLFAADDEYRVQVFDVADGRLLRSLVAHQREVLGLAVDPREAFLATASKDRSIVLWHLKTWQPQVRLSVSDELRAVGFSSDGAQLLALDRMGRRWSWELKKLREKLPWTAGGFVAGLSRGPDDGVYVRTQAKLSRVDASLQPVWQQPLEGFGALAGTAEGVWVGGQGVLALRSAASGELVREGRPCAATVASVAASDDGKTLWAACGTQVFELDASTLKPKDTAWSSPQRVRQVAVSQPAGLLAWVAADGSGQLWSLRSRTRLGEWTGGYRESVAFNPDGSRLLLAGASGLSLRETRGAALVSQLTTTDLRVRAAGFLFGSSAAWHAGHEGVGLWDISSGRMALALPGLQREPAHVLPDRDDRGVWIGDSTGELFHYRWPDPAR